MLCFGILDHWVFYFNPLQRNIFLDKEAEAAGRKSERHRGTGVSFNNDQVYQDSQGGGASPREVYTPSVISLDNNFGGGTGSQVAEPMPLTFQTDSKLVINKRTFNTLQQQ